MQEFTQLCDFVQEQMMKSFKDALEAFKDAHKDDIESGNISVEQSEEMRRYEKMRSELRENETDIRAKIEHSVYQAFVEVYRVRSRYNNDTRRKMFPKHAAENVSLIFKDMSLPDSFTGYNEKLKSSFKQNDELFDSCYDKINSQIVDKGIMECPTLVEKVLKGDTDGIQARINSIEEVVDILDGLIDEIHVMLENIQNALNTCKKEHEEELKQYNKVRDQIGGDLAGLAAAKTEGYEITYDLKRIADSILHEISDLGSNITAEELSEEINQSICTNLSVDEDTLSESEALGALEPMQRLKGKLEEVYTQRTQSL